MDGEGGGGHQVNIRQIKTVTKLSSKEEAQEKLSRGGSWWRNASIWLINGAIKKENLLD